MDDAVDELHGKIITYLGQISQQSLTEGQTEELTKLMAAANDLENIGDLIETNLVTLGLRRREQQVVISDATREVIEEFHPAVARAFDAAMSAVTTKSVEARRVVAAMKQEINRLAESAALHEARRLVAEEPNRLPAYTVEMGVLENLKRIYYFTKRMARAAAPPGENLTGEAANSAFLGTIVVTDDPTVISHNTGQIESGGQYHHLIEDVGTFAT